MCFADVHPHFPQRYNAALTSYPCNKVHLLSLPSWRYNMHEFADVAEKASVRPVECAGVNAHGQGGALLVTGTVLTLSK
jgi:hypothetical protein